MPEHLCNYEERWGKVLVWIERSIKHIEEGESSGGFRDRVTILEQTVSALKKSYWKTAIVCGLIGGLIGKISPEIFNFLIKTVLAGTK
jgi:hypothetical protein